MSEDESYGLGVAATEDATSENASGEDVLARLKESAREDDEEKWVGCGPSRSG